MPAIPARSAAPTNLPPRITTALRFMIDPLLVGMGPPRWPSPWYRLWTSTRHCWSRLRHPRRTGCPASGAADQQRGGEHGDKRLLWLCVSVLITGPPPSCTPDEQPGLAEGYAVALLGGTHRRAGRFIRDPGGRVLRPAARSGTARA